MESRDKLIFLVTLSAALLGGCATGGQSSVQFARPDPRFYSGRMLLNLDRSYLDRYTCPEGKPPICSCASLRTGTCDCSC
jgi:hypothetical protein